MTIDTDTINTIIALSKAGGQADLKTDIPTIMVPDAASIASLEKFQATPARFRAKYNTRLLSAFTEYMDGIVGEDSAVFIDPDNMRATAYVDLGTHEVPQWRDHSAVLTLDDTPAYAAVTGHAGKMHNQRDMTDFIEDWAENIQFYADVERANAVNLGSALTTIRHLTLKEKRQGDHHDGDFKASRSTMEEVEVASGDKPLPACFTFTTPPYMGFQPRTLTCRLRATSPDGKTPALTYRIMGLDRLKEELAEEFKGLLYGSGALGAARVHVGTLSD